MGRERLQWWLHPLHITQQWCLASMAVWVPSTCIPICGFPPSHPLRLSPHSQQQSSPWVFSPIPMFQLSAHVHRHTHVPVWGAQGCGTDHLCRSHSVLSAPRPAISPSSDSLRCSPSVPTDFPVGEGASPDVGTSPLLQLLLRCTDPILLALLFFFPSFFHPVWLCGDLSCPFQCPRSSAGVQLVFFENYSICRCILDAFVERDELHIFLLHRHLGFSLPEQS